MNNSNMQYEAAYQIDPTDFGLPNIGPVMATLHAEAGDAADIPFVDIVELHTEAGEPLPATLRAWCVQFPQDIHALADHLWGGQMALWNQDAAEAKAERRESAREAWRERVADMGMDVPAR